MVIVDAKQRFERKANIQLSNIPKYRRTKTYILMGGLDTLGQHVGKSMIASFGIVAATLTELWNHNLPSSHQKIIPFPERRTPPHVS